MNDEADNRQSDEHNNEPRVQWLVRGVEPETRKLAISCARRRRVSLGEWVTETVHERAARELKGEVVLPRMPPEVAPDAQVMMQLNEWLQTACTVTSALQLAPASARRNARHFNSLLEQALRAARGMPQKARRKPLQSPKISILNGNDISALTSIEGPIAAE